MYSIKRVAKKLVILQGNSSIGKITILLQVIDHLKEGRNFVTVTHQLITRHDQRVLLKNDRGFSVAICTAGDSLDIIEENNRFFQKHGFDVMISACNINVKKPYRWFSNKLYKNWVGRICIWILEIL